MIKFNHYLTEKLVDINQRDINMLWKPVEPIIRDVSKVISDNRIEPQERNKNLTAIYSKYQNHLVNFSSSNLSSPACRAAHQINPVEIFSGVVNGGNRYEPKNKKILVGIPGGAYLGLLSYDFIPKYQIKKFHSEFTELRIKSTIVHELVHWVDDSINNLHMTKFIEKEPGKFYEYLKKGKIDVNLGPVEINAVVNQINIIKGMFSQEQWDNLSWDKMIRLHPHLIGMDDSFGRSWRILVKKRMARENILGKNMR